MSNALLGTATVALARALITSAADDERLARESMSDTLLLRVQAYVREHLADYKRPRVVEFVEELPRDPNGKVRKPKLREAYLARRPS